jgi:hypothetical protein
MSAIFGEDFRPHRLEEIMVYEVEEELSLYDPRAEVVHILNPTAAVIWGMCDGSRRVQDISSQITEAYNLSLAVAKPDVQETITKFLEAGLIC